MIENINEIEKKKLLVMCVTFKRQYKCG